MLGHPASYFREPDERAWAARLGVPVVGERVANYRQFAHAVKATGETGNGVFAARIMWGSLGRMMDGLGKDADESDVGVLKRTLGPLSFIHLRRNDAVAQAVSWARAEQTGFWQQGDVVARQPRRDLKQMVHLFKTIREHNGAWRTWFDRHGVEAHDVTYEELVADPRGTVHGIAARVGVAVPASWEPLSPHQRQADHTNDEWAAALRDALERAPE